MTVLVLSGGDSPEREVSLRSGSAITDALRKASINVTEYDPINGNKQMLELAKNADIVFPILHGKNGEDGVIQELLESVNVKFLGSNSKVSRVCFDKEETHKILESKGVVMPKYKIVCKTDIDDSIFSKPFVLKPNNGGSSLDTLVARELNSMTTNKAKELLTKYDFMIAEELIEGTEITVAVLGDQVLPAILILPPKDSEFDYDNKYNGKSKEICPIPDEILDEKTRLKAEKIALKIHNILGARHLSRTDMIVDGSGKIYVLELNTIPGMTNQSLFPVAAGAVGLTMEKLVLRLINIVNGVE